MGTPTTGGPQLLVSPATGFIVLSWPPQDTHTHVHTLRHRLEIRRIFLKKSKGGWQESCVSETKDVPSGAGGWGGEGCGAVAVLTNTPLVILIHFPFFRLPFAFPGRSFVFSIDPQLPHPFQIHFCVILASSPTLLFQVGVLCSILTPDSKFISVSFVVSFPTSPNIEHRFPPPESSRLVTFIFNSFSFYWK